MKKCIRWMSLAAVVFAAAGVLWGCGSGAGREASATMAAQPPPAANTYAAKAAETMAAMEAAVPGPVMDDGSMPEDGEGSPMVAHNTEEYRYNPENPFMAVSGAPLSTFWGRCGYGILCQHPQDASGRKPGSGRCGAY